VTARLLIVRHGESTWNAVRRWQGQADPPLTERGERQARSAAARLSEFQRFDIVVTSSLHRARRTGELLAQEASIDLGHASAAFAERAAGAWEGLTRDEIEERYPGYIAGGQRPAGYEEDESIIERAIPALRSLAEEYHGQRVIVVSHGGVVNALERHAEEGHDYPWERVDNLGGRWFEYVDECLLARGSRVSLLPDTASDDPVDPAYA